MRHNRIINTTGKDDWATPLWVVQYALQRLDVGRFDLDAAAKADTAKAAQYLGPDHTDPAMRDALSADWAALGQNVWCNPPYSRKAGGLWRWLGKAVEASERGATVAALFFARTETAAWHDHVLRAAEVHLFRGRLSFIDPATGESPGPAPAPSALVIWRANHPGPPVFVHPLRGHKKSAPSDTLTQPPERVTKRIKKMSHLSSVVTNLKGSDPTPVEYTLGAKTLIVGPNGAGKSTIPQAIELALTGRVSDVAGKDPKKAGDVATLAPLHALTLEARVSATTGTGAYYRLPVSPKVGRAKQDNECAAYLPLRELKDALKSDEKAQRYLLGATSAAVTWDDVLLRIPPGDSRRLFDAVVPPGAGQRDPVGTLLQARDAVHRTFLDERGRVTSAKTVIEGMGGGLAPAPTVQQLTDAREALQNARDANQASERHAVSSSRLANESANLQQRWRGLLARRAILVDDVYEIETAYAVTGSDPADVRSSGARVDAAYLLLARLIEVDSPVCGLCASAVPAGHWEHRQAAVAAVAKAKTAARRWLGLQDEISQIDTEIAGITQQLSAIGEVPVSVDPHYAVQSVAHLVDALDRLNQLKGKWSAINTARATMADAEKKRDDWKRLQGQVAAAISDLVTASRDSFVSAVQGFLPDSDTFGLEFDPLRFGLVRGGKLHTALSGAEWARVTMAIASVASQGRAGIPVIVPEDRAWDPVTLANAMRALTDAPGQVIICTTVKPKGRAPKGWTVIDVTRDAPKEPEVTEEQEVAEVAEEPEITHSFDALTETVSKLLRVFAERPGMQGASVASCTNGSSRTGEDVQRVLASHLAAGAINADTAEWVITNIAWANELVADWVSAHAPLVLL